MRLEPYEKRVPLYILNEKYNESLFLTAAVQKHAETDIKVGLATTRTVQYKTVAE